MIIKTLPVKSVATQPKAVQDNENNGFSEMLEKKVKPEQTPNPTAIKETKEGDKVLAALVKDDARSPAETSLDTLLLTVGKPQAQDEKRKAAVQVNEPELAVLQPQNDIININLADISRLPGNGIDASEETLSGQSVDVKEVGLPVKMRPDMKIEPAVSKDTGSSIHDIIPVTTNKPPVEEYGTIEPDKIRLDITKDVAFPAENVSHHQVHAEPLINQINTAGTASFSAENQVNQPSAVVTTGVLTQEVGTSAWQQSLGQQIACFTRDGVYHAELRLHPEELGALQISMRLNNDQAQLHFVTGSHQVQAALEAAMPELRTSLAESGINLGQSSVGADSTSGGTSHSQGQNGYDPTEEEESGDVVSLLALDNLEISGQVNHYLRGISTFV